MPISHRRSLWAVALKTREGAFRSLEEAEESLAAIDREIASNRRRAAELEEAVGRSFGEVPCPAALLESAALARSSSAAALLEVSIRLAAFSAKRERAARALVAAREALAHATRAAQLFSQR